MAKKKVEKEVTLEDKLVEELIKANNGEMVTYKDLSEALNKIRGKMIQKLLDKEFEHHMEYEKGSHEEKTTTNRRNGVGSKKTIRILFKL